MNTSVGVRVLVIDDDRNVLSGLRRTLEGDGYEAVLAESAEKGLEVLKETPPDIIVLDIGLPGMGGIGFLKEISLPDGKLKYPVVVLTGRKKMADFFSNMDVDAFIEKPCEPSDLLKRLKSVIASRGMVKSVVEKSTPHLRKRILLAEDDAERGKVIKRRFSDAGFDVESVDAGADVMERVFLKRPDVVVMKRILHGMNGDRMASLMYELPKIKDIPVVLYDEANDDEENSSKLPEKTANVRRHVSSGNVEDIVSAVKVVLASV